MVGAQSNFPVQLSPLEADSCHAQRGRRNVLCPAEPRYQLFGLLLSRHNLFIIYLLFSQHFIFFSCHKTRYFFPIFDSTYLAWLSLTLSKLKNLFQDWSVNRRVPLSLPAGSPLLQGIIILSSFMV